MVVNGRKGNAFSNSSSHLINPFLLAHSASGRIFRSKEMRSTALLRSRLLYSAGI